MPAPGDPLFEAAIANFSPHSPANGDIDNDRRGPLLAMMGGHDNTVPEAISKATLGSTAIPGRARSWSRFADRGDSLEVDHGWRDIADRCPS